MSFSGCASLLLMQFHAAEYPAFSNDTFPIFLGHCQKNSTCVYHPRAMDLRNILWYQVQMLTAAVLHITVPHCNL
jgi:hypothetical protein